MKVFKIEINENDDETGMFTNSFVHTPAHMKGFQLFNKTDKPKEMFFANNEKQIVTGVVIQADKLIPRYDESIGLYNVYFDAPTIEKIMVKFAGSGLHNSVDLEHNANEVAPGVSMFESYIVNKENGIYPLHLKDDNISNGSWCASYKITDKKLWERIKKGEFNGFSISIFADHIEKQVKKQKKVNNMNKSQMSVRELLFGKSNKTQNFATATTVDGVEISYEGELAVGTAVFIDADGEQLPAPAGVHVLTGEMENKSIVVDENGMVSEIIDVPTDVPAEDVAPLIDAIVEEMKSMNEKFSKMELNMAAITKENAELVKTNNELSAKVETFANKTIESPKTTFKPVSKNPHVDANPLLNKYLK